MLTIDYIDYLTIGGITFSIGKSGSPILDNAMAYLEFSVQNSIVCGDHTIILGEVVEAGINCDINGRPDEKTLVLKDLGEKVFYGG